MSEFMLAKQEKNDVLRTGKPYEESTARELVSGSRTESSCRFGEFPPGRDQHLRLSSVLAH